ncbi:MAG TPA: chemotaxis protein CheW [Blastocatellia bacterium]|nr:chemotaxis protein CheW [Blastocatellia bacterium]
MEKGRGKYESIPGLSLEAFLRQVTSSDAAANEEAVASFLVFEIAGEPFAIGVEHTEGVVNCPRITPLPHAPEGIAGVVSVRGRITLVMDLSNESGQRQERRRLILLKGDAQLGLLADHVEGVVALPPEKVLELPSRKQPGGQQAAKNAKPLLSYFKKNGRRVPILDVERLANL